nr:hypothetical protein [uncultured Blautia sp.]
MAKPKKFLRGVGIVFLVLAVFVLGVLGWFTLREYRLQRAGLIGRFLHGRGNSSTA